MRKRIILFVCIVVLAAALVLVSHLFFKGNPQNVQEVQNSRSYMEKEGWYYYYKTVVNAQGAESEQIIKVKQDGTRKTIIYAGDVGNMILADDYLYCTSFRPFNQAKVVGNMFRLSLDGEKKERLRDSSVNYNILSIRDGWIFCLETRYTPEDKFPVIQNRGISKMKVDGTESQRICQHNMGDTNMISGLFYYINASDGDRLYRLNLDTYETKMISPDQVKAVDGNDFTQEEEWLYYIAAADGKTYRVRLDGTEKTQA